MNDPALSTVPCSIPTGFLGSRELTRRKVIPLLGGAACAWPFAARAQQQAMPAIRYLGPGSPSDGQVSHFIAVFCQSLVVSGVTARRRLPGT
jgi:putative ABC transport system substrate-binding protein